MLKTLKELTAQSVSQGSLVLTVMRLMIVLELPVIAMDGVWMEWSPFSVSVIQNVTGEMCQTDIDDGVDVNCSGNGLCSEGIICNSDTCNFKCQGIL